MEDKREKWFTKDTYTHKHTYAAQAHILKLNIYEKHPSLSLSVSKLIPLHYPGIKMEHAVGEPFVT